ncbi:hypothetical protein P106B_26 [Rhizobium phage vB_RglS_P106B]|uniref:HK97 gp10 family phage protein n=1 Tax=Rhizobium phage vB_RglS_P106B TaxID=1458697 RepID=W6E8K5_9CAUD|nr:hypothetical protein P106B_26 [Rhizobium phage vB_RglS_P106B]AHJ10709.1 hypothetical protein P106B_26 [Rhizobium phage vB_RglS_P106B]
MAADIDRIVVNTEKRMLLVMKQSLINAINEMQTPVGKGGKMRVDTGFLRASGQASLNGMPSGPSMKPKEGSFDWSSTQTEATIGSMQFGAVLHWAWTANYARYREAYDGFMYSTLQNWQQIVDKVVAEAKARFP